MNSCKFSIIGWTRWRFLWMFRLIEANAQWVGTRQRVKANRNVYAFNWLFRKRKVLGRWVLYRRNVRPFLIWMCLWLRLQGTPQKSPARCSCLKQLMNQFPNVEISLVISVFSSSKDSFRLHLSSSSGFLSFAFIYKIHLNAKRFSSCFLGIFLCYSLEINIFILNWNKKYFSMDFLKYHASSRLPRSLLLCYCGGKSSVCFVGDKSRRKLFQLSIKWDRLEAIWRSLGDSSRANLSAWHCVEVLGRNALSFHLNVSHFLGAESGFLVFPLTHI